MEVVTLEKYKSFGHEGRRVSSRGLPSSKGTTVKNVLYTLNGIHNTHSDEETYNNLLEYGHYFTVCM